MKVNGVYFDNGGAPTDMYIAKLRAQNGKKSRAIRAGAAMGTASKKKRRLLARHTFKAD